MATGDPRIECPNCHESYWALNGHVCQFFPFIQPIGSGMNWAHAHQPGVTDRNCEECAGMRRHLYTDNDFIDI